MLLRCSLFFGRCCLALFVLCELQFTASTAIAGEDERITSLKTFINDRNFVLFHNELMELQRRAWEKKQGIDRNSDFLIEPFSEFLIDLWELNTANHPELKWDIAEQDEFRNSVAATMTLGARDGWFEYDMSIVNEYLRVNIFNENEYIASSSMHILASSRDKNENDIQLLLSSTESKSNNIFRSAVTALGIFCSSAAEIALKQLESDMLIPSRKTYVRDTREKFYGTSSSGRRCQ